MKLSEASSLTSNALDGTTRLRTNLVGVGSEAPEALGAVNRRVGERAGVLVLVNEAKVVGARGVVLQCNSKQGRVQLVLDSVKEGSLRFRLDGIDGAESQTKQTVVVLVVDELLADLGGSLNRLGGGPDTTNDYKVLVDVTASRALVTVGDGPFVASQLGGVTARLVEAVTSRLGSGQLRGEDPARPM